MKGIIIAGTGSYTPENIMSNDDLSKIVDTNDEWISSRTGIKQRRISTGENTSDLAFKAALNALDNSKETPENIDLIICATMSPDFFMPSTACIVQAKLGAKNAVAFDLSAACTGFIYALVTAIQFIKSGMYKTILVVGAETISKQIDWNDRATCVLFGDGAGAVLLKSSESKNSILSITLHTDGTKREMLKGPCMSISNTYVSSELNTKNFITMQGGDVFKFAVNTIIENIKEVLQKANCTIDDIKYIVPHQANIRIIKFVAKLLKVEDERFFTNIEKYANTSAASIGIALDELLKNNMVNIGDKLILVGFGAGMTSGAILIEY